MDNTETVEKQFRDESVDLMREIFNEAVSTIEFKKARNAIVDDILSSWAEGSRIKKKIAQYIQTSLKWENNGSGYEGKTNIENLGVYRNLGKLVTAYSKVLSSRDSSDADRIAKKIEKPIKDFLDNTDFGYIYDMVENSENRTTATFEKIGEILADYPSKVGILPAIKIRQINTGLKKKSILLNKTSGSMSPENLVATITVMIEKLISGENLAEFINELTLLIHKMGVGNEIMSEAEKTAFEYLLVKKLDETIPLLDIEMACKAIKDIKEIKESIQNAFLNSCSERPELSASLIEIWPDLKNGNIRMNSKKAVMVEEFSQTREGAEKIGDAISRLDFQELGDTINAWLRTLNALQEGRSGFLRKSAVSLLSSIDQDDLQDACKWLIPDLADSFKSLSHIFMPTILNGFTHMLTPSPGMDNSELEEAIKNFKAVLGPNGGADA